MNIGIGIDVETSGANLLLNSLVAVGVAVMDLNTGNLIEPLKRWTLDISNINWEQRCIDQFWSKNESLLENFKNAPNKCADMSKFALEFHKWYNEMLQKYNKFIFYTDFAVFDIAWVNIALNKANLPPLYMLNGSWQNILDIDSFEKELNNVNIDMSDFTLVRHLPENDAYFIVLKYYRLCIKNKLINNK